MMLPVARELAAIVTDTMAPALVGAGFSRRGDDFLRLAGDSIVQVLSIQTSEYASPTYVRWTYNLAPYIPELLEIRDIPRPDATPDAVGCFFRVRLSALCRERCTRDEFWYDLGDTGFTPPASDAASSAPALYDPRRPDSVRAIVRADLAQLVIPFLDRMRTWADWLAWIREPGRHEGSAFEHLVLALLTGDQASARTMYERCFRDRPEVRRYVRQRFDVDLHA